MIEKVIATSRTTEVDALVLLIIASYQSSDIPEDNRLIAIMAKVQELSVKLNLAIYRIKTESDLEARDNERCISIRSFYYVIFGCTTRTDEAVKTAALVILNIFNHYGLDITRNNYGVETSLIKSLITDLSTEVAQTNLAIVPGASDAFVEMKDAEAGFETSNLAYEKAKAEESLSDNATTLKKQLVDVVNNQLVSYLRVMLEIEDNDFEGFAEVVKQLISDSNGKVKNRLTEVKDE